MWFFSVLVSGPDHGLLCYYIGVHDQTKTSKHGVVMCDGIGIVLTSCGRVLLNTARRMRGSLLLRFGLL